MIAPNLTNEQLEFLLYGLCSESYEEMVGLRHRTERICIMCEPPLWCHELFLTLRMNCPEELRSYGWKDMKELLNGRWLSLYQPNNEETDDMWHITLPLPEKLEDEFETWKKKNS